MFDSMDFVQNLRQKMVANKRIWNDLVSQTNRIEGVTLPTVHPGHFCFRVTFSGSDYGLSISCPPDFNGFVETALFQSSTGKLIYDDEKGYDDICRFSNIDELIAEINRVKEFYRR
jgi:hypothetical protein